MIVYYLWLKYMISIQLCMHSLINNERNGSKKNEIIEVQSNIDGHKYNHK